ncbi:MAG: adenosylcobinamide-GDP ribazoletransferase [Streptomycetales bacterium]
MIDGLRLAFGTLSVLPVRRGRVGRKALGRAMTLAPLVGLTLGALAGGLAWLVDWLGGGALLAAAIGVTTMAVLTRGLHLDGLADTADGLGSNQPPVETLTVMRSSDIGPFGVLTLMLVLLLQVAALTATWEAGLGVPALIVAVTTGRLAVTWGCRRGIPAARPDGLGAVFAGSVAPAVVGTVTILVLALAVALALLGETPGVTLGAMPSGGTTGGATGGAIDLVAVTVPVVAVLAGLAASLTVLRHVQRRVGGVTGDVLGALVETATTVVLLVYALGS